MRYLHTMIRVTDLEASLDFFVRKMGMVELAAQAASRAASPSSSSPRPRTSRPGKPIRRRWWN